jgi:membrane protein implicated in regulation of membrane protease activity
MEYFWLTVAIVSLVLVGYEIYLTSFEESWQLLVITVLAFTWFGFRRKMRQRMEQRQSEQEQ